MLISTSATGLSATVRAIQRLDARNKSATASAASAAGRCAASCLRARAVSNRCTTIARSNPAFS